jgi:sortase (surface protein transpeptidase)
MKKVGSTAWRAIGALSLVVGLGLALAAAATFARVERQAVGDLTLIQETIPSDSSADFRASPPAPYLFEVPSTQPSSPLWEANRSSKLGAAAADPGPTPTRLHIEAIGVSADIQPHGVDRSTGQMDIPDNVSDVAWYKYGPSPGDPGSAVLAAHVDLQGQGPGVFFDLERLEPGDVITVGFDDGTDAQFDVWARTTYRKDQLPTEVLFNRDGPPILSLVTCGGGFDRSTSRYDSNVVVFASPRPAVGSERSTSEPA